MFGMLITSIRSSLLTMLSEMCNYEVSDMSW